MILSYSNKIFGKKKRHRVRAEVTTEHSFSSSGQPVIVLEDGGALDLVSWKILDYKVMKATKAERAALIQMGLIL